MKKVGFLQTVQEKYGVSHESNNNMPIPKSGYGTIYSGSTGVGKTRGLINTVRQKIEQGEGILLVDEKNVLHRELKHLKYEHFKEREIEIYQLGSPCNGKNDLSINLLEEACTSAKKSKAFFDELISDRYKNNNSGHAFWAIGASTMAYDTYNFIITIRRIMRIFRMKGGNGKSFIFSKDIELDEDTSLKFRYSGKPLTLNELNQYFIEHDTFRILSGKAYKISKYLKDMVSDNLDISNMTQKKVKTLDKLFRELDEAVANISQYELGSNKAEASGDNGMWFSIRSSIPSSLIDNPSLNAKKESSDLIEILEEGNIIVVDSETLDSEAVSTILNFVWDHLSLRSSKNIKHPVTCIVEEASRVLSPGTDLERTLAYARESNLSLILAVQSISQLKDIFGPIKLDSILNNVTHIKLSSKEDKLKKFHFRVNDDETIQKFEPLFLSKEALYRADLRFQSETGQFGSVDKGRNELVIYDQILYDTRGTVILIDLETMSEREEDYYPEDMGNNEFVNMLKSYIEDQIEIEKELEDMANQLEDDIDNFEDEDEYYDEDYDTDDYSVNRP